MAPPAKKGAAKGGGSGLSKKVGPLPVWGYIVAAVVGYWLYTKYTANKSTASTTASTGATPQTETITTAGGTYTGPAGQAPSSITNPAGSGTGAAATTPATTGGTSPSTPGSSNTSPGTPGSTGGIPVPDTSSATAANIAAGQNATQAQNNANATLPTLTSDQAAAYAATNNAPYPGPTQVSPAVQQQQAAANQGLLQSLNSSTWAAGAELGMSASGPNPISRVAAPNPQMPNSQGYIGTGGDQFRPNPAIYAYAIPNTWKVAPKEDWIGMCWAPGQGGDTPGGGGAAVIGQMRAVDTSGWVTDGFVNPVNFSHAPGTVGAQGRRGRSYNANASA